MDENSSVSTTTESTHQPEDLYVFVKFLGHGSFGRVNLYRNSTTNSLMVWKEIDLKRLDSKSRNEAFAEVEILSMLNHPNIISYFKNFIVDDTLYIELEYAKAGTLYSLIHNQKHSGSFFEQNVVLWYIYQLACAVDYIHNLGIMHRDIKTMNIFLMQSSLLKLGDFGIAKFLDPNVGFLESQVGTPMYLSPEIVEGRKYSTKSDIWALGCVAYELLALKKVFEATNQLKLALKISICDVNDIDISIYSAELRQLVKTILSKDPDMRPSAAEIKNHSIFSSHVNEFDEKINSMNMASKKNRSVEPIVFNRENSSNVSSSMASQNMCNSQYQNQIVASKLSEVYVWGGGKFAPKQLEFFKNENAPLHVACGTFHYAIINVEKELFTANHIGSNHSSGAKLGHDSLATKTPRRVDALLGINIEKVGCGDEMTICLSDDGDLYICGTNVNGCLGVGVNKQSFDLSNEKSDSDSESTHDANGDLVSITVPVKMPFFDQNGFKVKSIACGDLHCVALTTCNRVFTWGCGEYGRLGHDDEDDRWEPTELTFKLRYTFKNVYAGSDYSFLLTTEGRVLAFGNNEFNKLGLNQSTVGFKNAENRTSLNDSSNQVVQQLTPKLVKNLSDYDIYKICPGQNHTAFIDEFGRLFTFGSNRYGQLGVGDCKKRTGLNQVNGPLVGHHVTNAACGDTFTICSTSENLIFSWGNRQDGRLGLDGVASFDDTNCVSLPKPIFGSLHVVSEMSCKHWNAMIIAEKILNSKSMRSISYADYIRAMRSESVCSSSSSLSGVRTTAEQSDQSQVVEDAESETSTTASKTPTHAEPNMLRPAFDLNMSSEVPEWLKKDFADAPVIPIKQNRDSSPPQQQQQPPILTPQSQQLNGDEDIKTLEEALQVISRLREENLKLKEEIRMLKENQLVQK